MNVQLAAIIKQKLLTLPYFDKGSGLVQTVSKEDSNDQAPKGRLLKFPVEVDFSAKNLTPMIPDERIKGMFYVEDGGVKPEGVNDFTSDLTLICWFNPQKISADVNAVGVNAITDILNLLCRQFINEAPVTRLKFSAVSVPIRSADIFSKYTYTETDTQFLMPPYDFFAIKLKAAFRLSTSCLTPLEPAVPC